MKKLLAIMLGLSIIVSFAGCSKPGPQKEDKEISFINMDTYSAKSQAYQAFVKYYNRFLNGSADAVTLSGEKFNFSDLKKKSGDSGVDSFSLYDVTSDGLPELLIRSSVFTVITVSDNRLTLLLQEPAEYETTEILKNGAILSKHAESGIMYRYITFKDLKPEIIEFFDAQSDNENAPYSYAKGTVTKTDYERLISPFASYIHDPVALDWHKYDDLLFVNGLCGDDETLRYAFIDISGDKVKELVTLKNKTLSVYSLAKETPELLDSHDFAEKTLRILYSDQTQFYGLFTFGVSNGVNSYGYLSLENGKIEFSQLWKENFKENEITEISKYKSLIDESKYVYEKAHDVVFTDINSKAVEVLSLKINSAMRAFSVTYDNTINIVDKATDSIVQKIVPKGEIFGSHAAYAIDLDFDGCSDLIVPYENPAGAVYFCAYVWRTSEQQFVYAPGFEKIPNFFIDKPSRQILGSLNMGKTAQYVMYNYDSAKRDFSLNNSLEWSPSGKGVHLVETAYSGGFKSVVENAIVPLGANGQIDKTNPTAAQYFSDNSLWELDSPKWQNTFYKTVNK